MHLNRTDDRQTEYGSAGIMARAVRTAAAVFASFAVMTASLLPASPALADVIQAGGQAGSTENGGPGTQAASSVGVIVETSAVSSEDAPKTGTVEGKNATAGSVAGQQSAGEAADTAAIVDAVAPAGAVGTVAGANAGGPKVVTNSLFDGGELMMLSPDAASQMESFLIKTKSGKIIMIDGGTENETAHLKDIIRQRGGHVSAWLITHPHSDHVGALTKILEDPNSGITIDAIYYNFAPIEWYHANEEYRAQMVADCMAALSKLSPSQNHPNIQKGDIITVDDVTIRVMNQPYLFQTNAINNSSVAFRVEMNGKRILFLGDMGIPAGNSFLNEYRNELHELQADIVQMAHHGEQGVDHNVYEAVKPKICLWCCPEWLWNNDNGGGMNSGPWKTLEVRGWMRQLGVKIHVVEKDGDQILR